MKVDRKAGRKGKGREEEGQWVGDGRWKGMEGGQGSEGGRETWVEEVKKVREADRTSEREVEGWRDR